MVRLLSQPSEILSPEHGASITLSNEAVDYETLIYLFPPWNAKVVRVMQASGHDIVIDTNDPTVFILWGEPQRTLRLPGTDIGSSVELTSRGPSWVVTNYVPVKPHHLG